MSIPGEKRVLSRAELFDLVWSTPMFELCKQFHLSDNGLRKICKKYLIPIPKMGHWQKVRFGKAPKKPVLPDFQGEDRILIKVMPRMKELVEPSQIFTEPVAVPEHIGKFHPFIKYTKDCLKATSMDKGRYRIGRNERALDLRVGPDSLSRGLKIMDTVIKALEGRGVKVSVEIERDEKPFTYALIDGEKVIFSLQEGLKIVKLEPAKYSYMTQEFVPTGVLSLCIKNYFLTGMQTKWTDGKEKLEQKITAFLNGLFFSAAYLKKQTGEREAERQRWEAERKEEERRLLYIEEEKQRLQVLEQQAQAWQKSRGLRSFIRAAIKRKGTYEPESEFGRWVSWAIAYADRLDPLASVR